MACSPRESFDLISIVDERKETEIESIFSQLGIKKEAIHQAVRHAKSLKLLVTGRSGTGKSTIINGILGVQTNDDPRGFQWSKVEHKRGIPGTLDIEPFKITKENITLTVWDSRGLLDGTSMAEQDASLKKMVTECSGVDLRLFCIDMSQAKFSVSPENMDVLAMIKITNAFAVNDRDFWKNTIIVLTFANMVTRRPFYDNLNDVEKKKKFEGEVAEFKDQICEILCTFAKLSEAEARQIRVVPAGFYTTKDLPGREYWLTSLWIECLLTLPSHEAQGALIGVNVGRLTTPASVNIQDFSQPIDRQPIVIGPKVVESSNFMSSLTKVLACAAGGAVSGGAVGLAALVAGPIGAAIGVPAGALMGLCIGLALGVHKCQEEERLKKTK